MGPVSPSRVVEVAPAFGVTELLSLARGDEAAREPLQLLIGALVYHRKALKGFSDSTLHETVRQDPALVIGLFSGDAATLTAALPAIGGMHLASAALRIPTAVLEVIDADQ
jgi:hypothetical protein